MGFVKQVAAKLTGADVAADQADRAATEQSNAIRQSADTAAKNAQESAAQSARLQEQNAARAAAEGAAADALNKPLENADVQLGGVVDPNQTSTAASRKRRQTFGIGSGGSGVNI